MLTVVVRAGLLPQQIDDFPEGCDRSCKGALHIRSGTLTMTAGEWKHIQLSRPDLVPSLRVVSETKAPLPAPYVPPDDPPAGSEDEPSPEVETVTEIPEPTKSEESGTKKRRKRGFPDAH